MRTIYKIARTELQTLFFSPIAWLILIIFTVQAALVFLPSYYFTTMFVIKGYGISGITGSQFFATSTSLFPTIQTYLFLYIPLLTMGLMSREFASGSIKLLYSSPVTNLQIILGKYLSMMLFGLALIGSLFVFVTFSALTVKDFDFSAVLSGLLGLYLLICTYAAIGLFMSSLTSYQVVAAILTLLLLTCLGSIQSLWQEYDLIREVTYWMSISGRADELVRGLICSEDVLYFILVSTFFLALSIIRLNACRQKSTWMTTWWKYACVFLITCFLGFFSSRPALMTYYDTTATKENTLTQHSQEMISRLEGGFKITTYANFFDDGYYETAPSELKNDQSRFKQYVRFKPEMEMNYVYYYKIKDMEGYAKEYPGKTEKEIFNSFGLDSNKFLSSEVVSERVDVASEDYALIRVLERENGRKTLLRVYEDFYRHPGEAEITAAIKRLVMDLPKVGFLTGHDERNNRLLGDRDYNKFAMHKKYRYALINQGFDVTDVNLNEEIPAAINIIVVAEMKSTLTEVEQINLDKYIARGGNMLITSEPKRSEAMATLMATFGVKMVPGTLVNITENFSPDLVFTKPTKDAETLAYTFGYMEKRESVVTMPTVAGLEWDTDKGYTVTPLFVTDSTVWNELGTTNFVDEPTVFNPTDGEVKKSYVTGVALNRKVADREQKIMILGDADCISNGELAIRREDVRADNFSIIMGAFYWMSDTEVPIDVRRPQKTDDFVYMSEEGVERWSIFWKWMFPALLIIVALLIWIRRRSR